MTQYKKKAPVVVRRRWIDKCVNNIKNTPHHTKIYNNDNICTHHRRFTENIPCLPHSPNVLLLLLGITVVPREIEDNAYAICFFFGGGGVREAGGSGGEGVNEVHYGQNGKLKTFDVPASTRLQIKKISSTVLGNVKMVNSNFKTLSSVPRISAPLA